MFTGIIQAIGQITRLEPRGGDLRLHVSAGAALDLSQTRPGDSIAVNGVCLTVLEPGSQGVFGADVSRETLSLTSLGRLGVGGRVHLEKALTLATPLGGHLVSGHVDGLGRVLERRDDGRSLRLRLEAPASLIRYIAPKGSIAVDGVSLTVNHLEGTCLELNIVPHTRLNTLIDGYQTGTEVNLEVDLIARYLERLLGGQTAGTQGIQGITADFLTQHGYGSPS
ncbi:MAG: riboflavin synthase [Pseudomonadota bacterium]